MRYQWRLFQNLSIRYKLLSGYTLIFFFSTLLGGGIIYKNVRFTLEANIDSELRNATAALTNMVRTAADTSIKNHLRAVAEKNKEIVEQFHRDCTEGTLTETEAKALARKVLFSQTIGETGYIYCADSKGIAVEHPIPGVRGKNFMDREFVRKMIRLKRGYLEYNWQNPKENETRPKAGYIVYFEPWDWIIAVSSYREEFKSLVNVSDFEASILQMKFGKTGYAYLTDSDGNLIVHPFMKGNFAHAKDQDGHLFVKTITRMKTGKLAYTWKNPGEKTQRSKLVIFNYLPEYDWIVGSASYLDEMLAPLKTIRTVFAVTLVMIALLSSLTSLWINNLLITPLKSLMNRFSVAASDNFSVRMPIGSSDEIGQLSFYFNDFMERLERFRTHLINEVACHKNTTRALRRSEEMFSKAFRSNPSGMFIAALTDGKMINMNDSFMRVTGNDLFDLMGKPVYATSFFKKSDCDRVIKKLYATGRVHQQEISFITRSGELRSGMLSAETVKVWGSPSILGSLEDITESRRLEREIIDISERERQRIAMELHDDLCPQLIGIEVMTKILIEQLRSECLPITHFREARKRQDKEDPMVSFEGHATTIRGLILDAIGKTRQLSKGLSPVNLSDGGLEVTFTELIHYVESLFHIRCTLHFEASVSIEDHNMATHIYYIVHEAVHNAVKHAKATQIDIRLTAKTVNDEKNERTRLTIAVEDNGIGIQALPPSGETMSATDGMGLRLMAYRAGRIGGELDIPDHSGRGTTVLLEVEL